MTIDEARQFLNFLANKAQSGTPSTPEFNLAADRAQMQLFEKDYKYFTDSSEVSEALSQFQVDSLPCPVSTTGVLTTPSNYQHIVALSAYYVPSSGNGTQVPAEEVSAADWPAMLSSELMPPTKRFPKYKHESTYIRVAPYDIGICFLDYFRRPAAPVWGFTIVNGREVYDSATSTQFEWPDFAHNELVGIMCETLGINLQMQNLQEFAEMFKNQNAQIKQ